MLRRLAGELALQCVDLGCRSPLAVEVLRLGEQGAADPLESVGEVESGRPLGDQRRVPGTPAPGDLCHRCVEGRDGSVEVVDRPRPFRFEPTYEMAEVLRCVSSPGCQPFAASVELRETR